MEKELEALQRDLARFERGTRMMWLAGFAAAVIAAVLWGGARQAQSQATSLSTRALVLVDQKPAADRPVQRYEQPARDLDERRRGQGSAALRVRDPAGFTAVLSGGRDGAPAGQRGI